MRLALGGDLQARHDTREPQGLEKTDAEVEDAHTCQMLVEVHPDRLAMTMQATETKRRGNTLVFRLVLVT